MAVLSLAFAAAGGAAYLASLYASASTDALRRPGGSVTAHAAAGHATTLAPWRAEGFARTADIGMAIGDMDLAMAGVGARLSRSPGEAHAWLQAARVIHRRDPDAKELLSYYEMALARSPNSQGVDFAIANEALKSWRLVDEPVRDLWLERARRLILMYPQHFLRYVILRKQERSFCAFGTPKLHDLPNFGNWCVEVQVARAACVAPGITKGQWHWCASRGYLGEKPDAP